MQTAKTHTPSLMSWVSLMTWATMLALILIDGQYAVGEETTLEVQWSLPTFNDPAVEAKVERHFEWLKGRDRAAISLFRPVAIENTVLIRGESLVVAVNLANGKRIWQYPWSGSEPLPPDDSQKPLTDDERTNRIWGDFPYHQIVSDGSAAYLLTGTIPSSPRRKGFAERRNSAQKDVYGLVALNLRREGSLEWRIDRNDHSDEKKLNQSYFLAPPTCVDNRLFALVETKRTLRLVELDGRGNCNGRWTLGGRTKHFFGMTCDGFKERPRQLLCRESYAQSGMGKSCV